MNDGIQSDMSDTEYHRLPSLSASGAKLLLPPSCPAKYRQQMDNPPPPKPHFDFGHLVHKLVLGAGADIVPVEADNWMTKAAKQARDEAHAEGKIPALTSEIAKAQAMHDAIEQHPIAGKLLPVGGLGIFMDGQAETSLFATDPETGVKLRARPDWLTKRDGRTWIVDLKTTVTAEPGGFARLAAEYKYHLQAAFYRNVAKLLGLDDCAAFVLVAVEKTPPYLVTAVEFDAEAMDEGERLTRQAIDTYARCLEHDEWPGYPGADQILPISLPYWAINDEMEFTA